MEARLRFYLTGRVCVESGEALLDGSELGGRQGRLALAYLVVERSRAVTRDEMAQFLWPGSVPRSWETSLSAVVSNLRKALGVVGLERSGVIEQAFGCYQLRLPAEAWVDFDEAVYAADQAEGALRAVDPGRAHGWAGVATGIARREFLTGEDGPWVEARRSELRDVRIRGLDCFTEIFIWNREPHLAVKAAAEAVALEPFREKGYRRLMKAHAADGNRAEALRVYHRCREILAEELGVDPSPETEAVYLELLRLSLAGGHHARERTSVRKAVTIRLSDRDLARMEDVRERRRFRTRSDFVREAIRRMVREEHRDRGREESKALASQQMGSPEARTWAEASVIDLSERWDKADRGEL